MNHLYGMAVVQERTTPKVRWEVAEFVRWEYEPGTGLGYLLAAIADSAQPGRKNGSKVRRALRGFARRVQALANGHTGEAQVSRPGQARE